MSEKTGERILIRRKGDRTFSEGCMELVVLPGMRFGLVANRGFEVVRQDAEVSDEFVQNELIPVPDQIPEQVQEPQKI